MAVLLLAEPELIVSRLAYMRNLVREANRFGWDRAGELTTTCSGHRQHLTGSLDWAELSPSLMLTYCSARVTRMPKCHALCARNRTMIHDLVPGISAMGSSMAFILMPTAQAEALLKSHNRNTPLARDNPQVVKNIWTQTG